MSSVDEGVDWTAEVTMAGMYDHVQPIIDSLPLELSDEQRQMAIGLIKRNADVLAGIAWI